VGVFIEDLSYVGYATLFGEDYFTFDPTLLEKMEKAAKELDFLEAAHLRDEMFAMEKLMKEKFDK